MRWGFSLFGVVLFSSKCWGGVAKWRAKHRKKRRRRERQKMAATVITEGSTVSALENPSQIESHRRPKFDLSKTGPQRHIWKS